jgi:hypothetical protein
MADVNVDVRVSDNGSLQEVGKNARTADRNLKGAARTSANSTKNFSKMAQGITGGLVPAYATLAANIFAITAAFNFLKNAADFEILKKGQLEFAAKTGMALSSMTSKIQKASGGMLGFREAAQAAAIGSAKGFSTSQIEKLTVGARKAAAALGRDFEESFDRLVRGVSKAEPELLDELGITLRLEDATSKYAAAIGKSANALTTAERSQAVLLETQRQLDEQYGQMPVAVNAFVKLEKTFDKLVKTVTGFLLPAFEGLANFIAANATVAALAFGALGFSVLKTLPGIDKLREKINNIGSGPGLKDAWDDLQKFRKGIDDTRISLEQMKAVGSKKFKGVAGQLAKGSDSKLLKKANEQGFEGLHGGDKANLKKALKSAEAQYKKHGKITTGIFKDADIKTVRHFKDAMNTMEKSGLGMRKSIGNGWKWMRKTATVAARATRAVWVGAFRGIKKAAGFATKAIGKLMKATIILGVLSSIIDAFDTLINAPFTLAKNLASAVAGIGKTIQFIANLAVDVLNKVIEQIPESAFSFFGMDKKDWKMSNFTFADNIEADTMDLINKGLKMMGTNLNELADQEAKNMKNKRYNEHLQELSDGYKEMVKDIDAAILGVARLEQAGTDPSKTGRIKANILAGLDLGSEFRKALALDTGRIIDMTTASAEEIIEAQNKVLEGNRTGKTPSMALTQFKSQLKGIVKLVPGLGKAFKDLDITQFDKLGIAAQNTVSGISDLKTGIGEMAKQMLTGGIEAEQWVDKLIKGAEATDRSAEAAGLQVDALKELEDAFKGTGYTAQQYLELLRGIRQETEAIEIARARLAQARFDSQARGMSVIDKWEQRKLDVTEKQLDMRTALNEQLKMEERWKQAETDQKPAAEQALNVAKESYKMAVKQRDFALKASTGVGQILLKTSEGFASGMADAFHGIITGTMSVKEAFKSMAMGILDALARIIAEMMVVAMVKSFMGFGMSTRGMQQGAPIHGGGGGQTWSYSNQGGTLTSRYGGIMEPPGYATGGIARGSNAGYPVTMHGTEAVVPLPNNKSIPVDLKGAVSSQNVVVNVNLDSNGQGSTSIAQQDSQQHAQLGKLIALAVQEELQNQKRPGGILSPYGAT